MFSSSILNQEFWKFTGGQYTKTSHIKILQRDELGINCKAAGIFTSHTACRVE